MAVFGSFPGLAQQAAEWRRKVAPDLIAGASFDPKSAHTFGSDALDKQGFTLWA
jgi:hypothetical protein